MSNLRRRKSGSPSIIDKVPSPSIAETNARKLQAKEKQKQVSTTPTSKDAIENTINLFDRISEACNVRLPKQTAESDPIESMGFQALHNEPEALRNLRFQLFKSSLHSITSIIEDTQSTINLSLIQHVVQFVENASKLFMEPENVDSSRPFLNRREIMTALIFTGVNSHDHISTYDALVGSIARETRHKVAVLVPKNCTTIKNAVKRVVQQFVDETSEGWDSDEDEEAMSSRKIRKVPNYDMQGLLGWYQSSRREYTKEEETSQKGVPSLVLFIQDFELCDSRVLEQLIGVCCSYKDRLPIVLLFGIATSMETFHQVLSAGTISRLSTQNFKLQSPAECVESIIEKVFIQRKSGWKLGGDVLHTLLHRFWNYNSSVAELSRSIHLALLHFFYSNPLSIFCSPNTDIGANFNDAWNHINTDHLLNLQMCDSFRNHVLTLPAEKIAPLLSDTPNAEMKQFVFDALEGLDRYHERLRAGYECFRQFISLMDNYGKKAFRRFILAIQDGQVAKNDLGRKYIAHKDVKMLFGLFKRFPLESMSSYLSFLSTHLSLHSADYHENEITKVSELLEQITLLMGEQSREEDGDSDSDESIDGADNDESRSSPSAIDGVVANLGVNTPNGISNKKLRKLLSKEEEKASKNGRRNRRRKKETEESEAEELSLPERTEKFKTTATQFLEAYFSDVFQPYTTVLFHELYYWNDDRYLSKILTAQPRSTIQSVLNQPHDYLKCTCCDPKKIGANISPSLHDTSILYKLYQECGRMINLFDFFKAFESIVDREEAESGSQLGDGKEEPRIGRDENAVKRIKRKIVPKRNTRGRKKVQVGKGKGPSVDQDSDNENSFDTVEGDQGQSRPRKGQSEMVTEQNVKFARFIKSLGELQFLGFVKPTTRKTDHVVRLTWGRV